MREPVGNGTFILKPPFSPEEKREMFRTWQYSFAPPPGFADWPAEKCIEYIDSIDGWAPMDLRP